MFISQCCDLLWRNSDVNLPDTFHVGDESEWLGQYDYLHLLPSVDCCRVIRVLFITYIDSRYGENDQQVSSICVYVLVLL